MAHSLAVLIGLLLLGPLLSITISCDLVTPTCDNYTTITLSENGYDNNSCLNGDNHCLSLEFALNNVQNCTKVYVEYSTILRLNVSISVSAKSDIAIFGNGTQSVVDCDIGAGIAFGDVSDVCVENITWVNCSVEFASMDAPNTTLFTALYFEQSANVSIVRCNFTSRHGSGITMYNVEGTVSVTESHFVNNSMVVPCTNGSIADGECYKRSVGIHIENHNTSNSFYNIGKCLFQANDNFLPPNFVRTQEIVAYSVHRTVSHGGGLEIRLAGDSSHNTFEVKMCQFRENRALWGGGMEVGIGENSEFNTVTVEGCVFLNNYGMTGGGLRCGVFPPTAYQGYGSEEKENVFRITNCSFVNNTAASAAAISYIASRQVTNSSIGRIEITECTVEGNVANDSGAAVSFSTWNNEIGGYPTMASITNSNFTRNEIYIQFDEPGVYGLGVVVSDGIPLRIADTRFNANYGTALVVSSTSVSMAGEIVFSHNFGVNGGAIHLMNLAWITLSKGLVLKFWNNSAFLSGGAIFSGFYILYPKDGTRFCIIEYEETSLPQWRWDAKVHFIENTAKLSGASVYLSTPSGCYKNDSLFPFSDQNVFHFEEGINNTQIGTPAQSIVFNRPAVYENGSYVTQVMLGGQFNVYPITKDLFNQSSQSSAVLDLLCESCDQSNDTVYSIEGDQQLIQLNNRLTTTSFYLSGPLNSNQSNDTVLLLYSNSVPSAIGYLHLNITQCHLGYTYSHDTKKCECIHSDNLYCGVEQQVCIKYGYWIGSVHHGQSALKNCPVGLCGYSNGNCPTQECNSFETFCNLPEFDSNGLCSDKRGGILCTDCQPGYAFTFGALQCVPVDECTDANTALVFCMVVLFWALLIFLIFLALKLNLRIGSGQLYCLVYYFGVFRNLTTNNLPFTFLTAVAYTFSGFIELDPRFIGLADKCVVSNFKNLAHEVLRYIHPVFISLVVLAVIGVTHYSRFSTISKMNYGVRALCILLYLSFTALSDTSLRILDFKHFDDISGVYVSIEPTVPYFHLVRHLPYAIVAICVQVFIVLPFLFFMLFAPWIARIPSINLTRIKPILDEFQACYKDNYRCFAGYYLLCRQFVFLFSLIDFGEFGEIFFLQQLSLLVLVIHAVFQPYRKRWLNILDIILLGDLAVYSLFNGSTANVVLGDSKMFRDALVHILILIPVLYFLGLCSVEASLMLYHRWTGKKHSITDSTIGEAQHYPHQSYDAAEPSTRHMQPLFVPLEREPLLFENDRASYTATEPNTDSVSSDGINVDSEDQDTASPNSDVSTTQGGTSRATWYKRLSLRMTTVRPSRRSGSYEQFGHRRELIESTSVAKDVRATGNYTRTVVTTSYEDT